jgi:maltose alpha-D-glucosyltransferase/alpha-amylase
VNVAPDVDPLWYKDAIIYELHVKAFYDSVTDGIGDFPGLTAKLDYLQDLGITAIWLLPFCPSPLKDDGYDIADYNDVHPAYGSLRDFQNFMKEAKRRSLRVITELVINHTSDKHPWFQKSRRAAANSRWRNFYVWSETPDKYKQARIIFKDFEHSNWTWDPVAKAYYWHRFYSHQPDLNFENPEVRKAVLDAMEFWFDMGVDGLRLDAIPYLYEAEGTNCENLPQTHTFLKELRAHVEKKYPDKMLLAEANQWPEDAVAYFGNDDECHMSFHFPLMPRMFMALRMEDRYPITDIVQLTPAIPPKSQWALFLRNHDELTLEMVTDEERDYMYRAYAHDRQARINLGIRRRLAPLLGNDRRKIELMNMLLFALPGTPVIYYGDEIGMGDNFYLGDRNGVRTPMQWSGDRNAGFSRANPQQLYLPVIIDPEYHYEMVNVDAQQNNPNSLLWWMKRLMATRKRFRAFSRGTLEFVPSANRRVLAFVREFEGERILVVANLSRFAQSAELDLSKYSGSVASELFGRTEFPRIGDRPYVFTLGPYAFYWLQLEPATAEQDAAVISPDKLPVYAVRNWENVFDATVRSSMERVMPTFLRPRRWFLGKQRRMRSTEIADVIRVGEIDSFILIVRVEYTDGDSEHYVLPLNIARGEQADRILHETPQFVMARLQTPDGTMGILHAGIRSRDFADALLGAIARRRRFKGAHGEVLASHAKGFRHLWAGAQGQLEPVLLPVEHSHSTISYGNRLVLKLFRKIDEGINPEIEVGHFLSSVAQFPNVAPETGALEYRPDNSEPMTLGVLRAFVPHEADGWAYSIDNLGLFFERALSHPPSKELAELPRVHPFALVDVPVPPIVRGLIGSYSAMIGLLGERTAQMHKALASHPEYPDFTPEPFTDFYRQGLYHGMLGLMSRCFDQLRARIKSLPEDGRADVEQLLARENELKQRLKLLRDHRIVASRIRFHGDFHLGDVLFTGKDWVIIDFEGDTRRPTSERRIKRSALRDVCAMMRSFHYIAHAVSYGRVPGITPEAHPLTELQGWAELWHRWVSAYFLQTYLREAGTSEFVPQSRQELLILAQVHLMEKAFMEIEFELENRLDWVRIPVAGILQLLDFYEK